MGCGGSKGSTRPAKEGESEDYDGAVVDETCEDTEFQDEMKGTRTTLDKKTGEGKETDIAERAENKKEDDMFEVEEAGEGEQFMAVKPWLGAIVEPDTHPSPNSDAPDVEFELDYVYGYRCADSRQNLYYNANGEVVYMTAAVGVILDKNSNTQKFFGGSATSSSFMQRAGKRATQQHTDDIMALTISSDRRTCATGQVGSTPLVYIWDACSGLFKKQIKLPRGTRGVSALAFSLDGKHLAVADLHNDHNVYVFDSATGEQQFKDKGGPDRIFDIAWSKQPGDMRFVTAGIKHVKFWTPFTEEGRKVNKGLFMGKGKLSSFACATFDQSGVAYLGAMNGNVYKWVDRNLEKTYPVGKGLVHSINYVEGSLITGSYDNKVRVFDSNMQETHSFDCGSIPRALDRTGEGRLTYLVGAKDGSIKEHREGKSQILMQGHSEGEAWGLQIVGENIISCGDDNQILVHDLMERELSKKSVINSIAGARRTAGKGASTLSKKPPNQCARAVGCNSQTGHIAIGVNDGSVQIREGIQNLDNVLHTLTQPQEWIEVCEYSPDGAFLAVGSHDNNIYIYNVHANYELKSTCSKHNSFITSLDWSNDTNWIRSVCGAYELLFFNANTGEQDPSGCTNTKGVQWFTQNNKLGWNVQGVFPSGTDGSHVNGVGISAAEDLIVTGDDWGLVNVYRNPCLEGHKAISLRGHSEHVVRTKFNEDDNFLFSIGGYDQTIMQWSKKQL